MTNLVKESNKIQYKDTDTVILPHDGIKYEIVLDSESDEVNFSDSSVGLLAIIPVSVAKNFVIFHLSDAKKVEKMTETTTSIMRDMAYLLAAYCELSLNENYMGIDIE